MTKDLYELGETPPLGHVPERMYASVIRESRFGEPASAFEVEVVDTPKPGPRQVLVWVMAAGVNYNNVWASLGTPVNVIAARRRGGDPHDFHIGGSDASGVVWAVGDEVTNVKVGDPVVLSCGMWDEQAPDILAGADPISSVTARVWGYEINWGSFAQLALVDHYQCYPKPPNHPWAAAAAFMLVGATAYRQLLGWPPNVAGEGDPVLIWGGAGGLGCMAIQIARAVGALPVAVVSSEERAEFCRKIGAEGVILRGDLQHWGRLPDIEDHAAMGEWMKGAKAFLGMFQEALGSKRRPKVVVEHPGMHTIPTSIFVVDNGGMVSICAGTSGYNGDVDLRYLWMRQKRLQGSHYANVEECAALNQMIADGRVDPLLSEVFPFDEVGVAHQKMRDNRHEPGNMSILVNARSEGDAEMPPGL